MKCSFRSRVDNRKDNRKRTLFLPAGGVFLTLLFCLFLGGCGKPAIRVGFMADLSGRGSGVSIAARNGAKLAVKEINEKGGIKGRLIELHIKDDKGQADVALQVDQELVAEGVVLAIGHINSGPGLAGIPVLMEAGIPVISPAMSTPQLSGRKDLFFRVFPESGEQGEVIAAAAWKLVKGNERAAILMEENNLAYSEDLADGFQKKWEAAGGEVVYRGTYRTGNDIPFDRLAGEMLESGATTYLIVSGGLDLGIFVQKIRLEMPEAVIGSGMWGMTTDMIENAGRYGEGVLFPGIHDPDSTAESWQQFLTKYRETFSTEPLFSSMTAYEAVMVAAVAIAQADSLEGMALAESIVSHAPYAGLQQPVPLDACGDSHRDLAVNRLENGRFRKVVP